MIHRDLPDNELHGLKGAASALAGEVPVADGAGSTTFQKLGVINLTGSLPTSIPDLFVGTDGSGGFKAIGPAYGGFTYNSTAGTLVSHTATTGMAISGLGVKVATAGLYMVFLEVQQTITVATVPFQTIKPSTLIRVSDSLNIFNGVYGLVSLDPAQAYKISESGKFYLRKVTT